MREKRAAVAPEWKAEADAEICARLLVRHDIASTASPVAVYMASPSEINLSPFIRKHLERGCSAVAPRWNGETYEMALLKGLDAQFLRRGPMGILEPSEAEIVPPEEVKAWIVPGLAFTRDGRRLGYGGGWYDRLLARTSPNAVKIGVAYPFQLLPDLPCEPNDIPLTEIVA